MLSLRNLSENLLMVSWWSSIKIPESCQTKLLVWPLQDIFAKTPSSFALKQNCTQICFTYRYIVHVCQIILAVHVLKLEFLISRWEWNCVFMRWDLMSFDMKFI